MNLVRVGFDSKSKQAGIVQNLRGQSSDEMESLGWKHHVGGLVLSSAES